MRSMYTNRFKERQPSKTNLFNRGQIQGFNPEEAPIEFDPSMAEQTIGPDEETMGAEGVVPQESMAPDPNEAPPKKSFGTKLKEFFTTRNIQGTDPKTGENVDEFGVPLPMEEKSGLGKQILEKGLPMAFSALSGQGIIPGAMAALSGSAGRRKESREAQQEYGKTRADTMGDISDRDLKRRQMEEMADYREKMVDLKVGQVGKPTTAKTDKEMLDLETQYRLDRNSLTDAQVEQLNSWYRQRRTKQSDVPEAENDFPPFE